METGENLGGAGGFHYGLNYSVINGYKFSWIMDDDCLPSETALEELLNADNKLAGEYGFLVSKALWTDGSICTMNIPRRTIPKAVKDFTSPLVPVVMASFVSLFVPNEIIKELGLPIAEFFIWTDDWEFTRRISRQYKCYLVNESVVTHSTASNIGASIDKDNINRIWRYDYLYRNDVYLYRREGLYGLIYEILRLPLHTIKVLLNAKGNRLKRLKII